MTAIIIVTVAVVMAIGTTTAAACLLLKGGNGEMLKFPCRKCRRTFWSEKKLADHACGEIKEKTAVSYKRAKPKRAVHTRITPKVRAEIKRRAEEALGYVGCERCGSNRDLTAAHMTNASQMGSGRVPWNVVLLCGTHGTNGCHDWADNTADGREWKMAKQREMVDYYLSEWGRVYWMETE